MNHALLTVFGFSFVFVMTALGAALVFCFKKLSKKTNALLFGLASGVMVAASVWSLLLPSLEQAALKWNKFAFLPVSFGFIVGGVFLVIFDAFTAKIGEGNKVAGKKDKEKGRIRRLFFAVTLHNIPEGLAVGFAFGAASALGTTTAYLSALGLAVGIGIQNFPEGAAVALPMRAIYAKKRAFALGVASGLPEPAFAIIGYFTAAALTAWQPWLLAFSAGAMLFVVAQDLIPEMGDSESRAVGTWGVMLGFALMMALDVALG